MKHIILLAFMMVAANAFADTIGDKQLTSRTYVDTELDNKQDKIPAAGKPGVTVGDTVMTYTTGGNGVIGERGIYSNATNYNANTDADKLITAAALNDTFNSLPTVETSTMVCANYPTCTLWTITDDTAYGNSSMDLTRLINTNSNQSCDKLLSDGTVIDTNGGQSCTAALSNYGSWSVIFSLDGEPFQVSGISVCSSLYGSYAVVVSDQAQVQSDYISSGAGATTNTNPPGIHCYCKMTAPVQSSWVSNYPRQSCASDCADACAYRVRGFSEFRSPMFNSVQ